jgi:hypothetical protein
MNAFLTMSPANRKQGGSLSQSPGASKYTVLGIFCPNSILLFPTIPLMVKFNLVRQSLERGKFGVVLCSTK